MEATDVVAITAEATDVVAVAAEATDVAVVPAEATDAETALEADCEPVYKIIMILDSIRVNANGLCLSSGYHSPDCCRTFANAGCCWDGGVGVALARSDGAEIAFGTPVGG